MENVFVPIKDNETKEKNDEVSNELNNGMNDEANCLLQEVFTELEQIELDITKSLYELSCMEKPSLSQSVKD